MQFNTLFKKEMLENWRNKKWIWVPLVIIILSIMDPITSYYLPQIMESVGGMPEGTTFELPEFLPAEVVTMTLGQLSSLGVLIIVLMSMGTIAGERKSGVSELVLVKPVSYKNYILAKWSSLLVLVWFSLALGILVSWYYINLLFGELSIVALLQIIFFYGLWMTLVVSLTIFYNTVFRSSGLVAFLTILTIMTMSILTQIFGTYLAWSPNNLSSYIFEAVLTESIPSELIGTSIVTIILSVGLLIGSFYIFRTKELAN
ncbi:ABC transporter permease [Ornithinibacillus halophilus]|uniref:ABC-2 type transport system permease protein n=1 Tax=Ornithinibacillus halophilus TaxID=930117 RepID=A0A1M5MQ07_9BACI|nr:ABC transporter permease subunit [Ornithinibacillus halophilus]SHG78969.1 ABC-2 type transport system permease protein [Ornithinibacillus halophilus]